MGHRDPPARKLPRLGISQLCGRRRGKRADCGHALRRVLARL